jgi:hypothetical protein
MVEALVNCILDHLRDATPATRKERGNNYFDTLQLALDTLRGLTTSFHPDMQYKAVIAVLDFEKTRLRHNHPMAGIELKVPMNLDEPIGHGHTELREADDRPNRRTGRTGIRVAKLVDEAVESCSANDGSTRDRAPAESELWDQVCDHGFIQWKRSLTRGRTNRKRERRRHMHTAVARWLDRCEAWQHPPHQTAANSDFFDSYRNNTDLFRPVCLASESASAASVLIRS